MREPKAASDFTADDEMARLISRRILLSATFVGGICACGSNTRQLEFRQLDKSIDALQSQIARTEAKLTKLSDEVELLSAKLNAARARANPSVAAPDLPVVRLVPDTPAGDTDP